MRRPFGCVIMILFLPSCASFGRLMACGIGDHACNDPRPAAKAENADEGGDRRRNISGCGVSLVLPGFWSNSGCVHYAGDLPTFRLFQPHHKARIEVKVFSASEFEMDRIAEEAYRIECEAYQWVDPPARYSTETSTNIEFGYVYDRTRIFFLVTEMKIVPGLIFFLRGRWDAEKDDETESELFDIIDDFRPMR